MMGCLNDCLKNQYKRLEDQRKSIRENLIGSIEEGFDQLQAPGAESSYVRERALFGVFVDAASASLVAGDPKDSPLVWVARAVGELLGEEAEKAAPIEYAKAFIELMAAACSRDEGDANGDGQLDDDETHSLWSDIQNRLKLAYGGTAGGYARLMVGSTKAATRRLLQLAFNREHCHPMVLVAQSVVGREGLNLHKACRTVILLHPEWNPGVVEQQIGRVDRIGSLWARKLDEYVRGGQFAGEAPRIEVRSVVFRGTYDEENWRVLNERWDDLRAQLHGVVISPRIASRYPGAADLVAEINGVAPNFSPLESARIGSAMTPPVDVG